MKDLNKLFIECMEDVKAVGLKPGNIVSVTINSRAKKRWGLCRAKDGMYSIEISNRLLDDSVADVAAKNTLVHEILHTCPDCMNHGTEWQRCADIVNKHYNGYYTISRTTTSAEKGLEPIGKVRNDVNKYVLYCNGCGREWHYKRAGKVIQHPQNYRCGVCRGRLQVFTID